MRISFDFDGTLEDEFGGVPVNEQKLEIQSLAKRYISEGHDVMILTKRYFIIFDIYGPTRNR